MARKARVEVEGGLYHVITRGNNRRQIFNSSGDYEKFLSLLATQKVKLPFFLYAYCLMPNHVHLLIERQENAIGRIMHRLLTGYAQYYNWRYRRVGHLFQGRHKAILCQSDRYLSELVRYIHLNPVRALMVDAPEDYQYSSHRAYLGLEPRMMVDVDPVLRHFGPKKKMAHERYRHFVAAGMADGHCEEFYAVEEGRILGTEEFVDATIHRLGEVKQRVRGAKESAMAEIHADRLVAAVEKICRVSRAEFCGRSKSAEAVMAKEMLILVGSQIGASRSVLSGMIGLSSSSLSRRCDAGRAKLQENMALRDLAANIIRQYRSVSNRESQKSEA